MRKLACLFSIFIISTVSLNATHYLGGEITWRCLSNGQYIFYMNVYYDCSGIPASFQNEALSITGFPLPTNSNGTVSSIIMKADSNKFVNYNNGDISPNCASGGTTISCSAGNGVQMLSYNSDPVTLLGNPPTTGWRFNYELPCCRSSYDNVFSSSSSTGAGLLTATLFQTGFNPMNPNTGTCLESSPTFAEIPDYFVCSNSLTKIDFGALDYDGDSLAYKLAIPLSGQASFPQNITYSPGYSATNPTPDQSIDSLNIPFLLDPNNGATLLRVNTSGSKGTYLVKVAVDAYRSGVKMSSVSREVPIMVDFCQALPTGNANASPLISIAGSNQNNALTYYDTVTANQTIQLPLQFQDFDFVNGGPQAITVVANGVNFSSNLAQGGSCSVPANGSCAYLTNQTPTLNPNSQPVRYSLQGTGQISTQFVWNTNCDDLGPNESMKTYFFTLIAKDDYCPKPGSNLIKLAITVAPTSIPCALTTGLDELEEDKSFENSLKLFPNPNNGKFFLELQKGFELFELKIRNSQGKLVQQSIHRNQKQLNLEIKGQSGIYFVQILNNKGEEANLKVMKQ